MLDRVRFRFDERTIILFGIFLILLPLSVQLSGFRVTDRLLPTRDLLSQSPIGEINRRKNTVRKRAETTPVFSSLSPGEALFVGDRILTGKASSARITLSDGNLLELGPESLIRIEPIRTIGFGGIKRKIKITLESGTVKAAVRPNSAPIVVENPKGETILEAVPPPAPPTQTQTARVESPPAQAVPPQPEFQTVTINEPEAPAVKETLRAEEVKAAVEAPKKVPGLAEREEVIEERPLLSKITLAVRPPAEEIRFLPFQTTQVLSVDLPLNEQTFRFQWKPVGFGLDGAYRVIIREEGKETVREIVGETLTLPVPDALSGALDLQIEGKLKTGEAIRSRPQHFEWKLPAPVPVSPVDGSNARTSRIRLGSGVSKMILGWKEMKACPAFRVEISREESSFSRPESVIETSDNFAPITLPEPGNWKWRVICKFSNRASVPSTPLRFKVDPESPQ